MKMNSIILSFSEYHNPREPCLSSFKNQEFKKYTIIVYWFSPLIIVIIHIDWINSAPGTANRIFYHTLGFLLSTIPFIACSITCPTINTFSSQRTGPRICIPTGRSIELSSFGDAYPTGTVRPGIQANEAGSVNISSR